MQPSRLFFLDTNIFVYALLDSEPLKKQRALELIEHALSTQRGCVSYQILQEFSNVATHKFRRKLTTDETKQFVEAALQPLNRVGWSLELLFEALQLQTETGYSFFESLMLCAALHAGADTVYTEDLQHHQLIKGRVRIVNPFLLTAHEF